MFVLLVILWFVFELKSILFWLYLWQLKEYHVGRFLDHFSTYKGKKLLFSAGQIIKLALLVLLLAFPNLFFYLLYIFFAVYLAESLVFIKQVFQRTYKSPTKTLKILFLKIVCALAVILFLMWVYDFDSLPKLSWLVAFDILTPIIVSAAVLVFQPFFVLLRDSTLRKAKIKLEKIKQAGELKVVVITGSYGKTSTKEFLATILSKKYKVLSTKKHQNSEIGVAKSVLNELRPGHQIFIAEVGAYNKGKVKEVCSMLKPEIGIVTGVNEQHLSLFGSMKNLLSAEGGGELASFLEDEGMLIVNGDNKYCLDFYRKFEGEKRIYGTDKNKIDADLWAEDISVKNSSISFVAVNKNREMAHFDVEVLGRQNVQNLLAAILAARELGMGFDQIVLAGQNIGQEMAGMVLKQGKHGINIIDSSYSANPDGVFADLDYLNVFSNKKVIVMPCLIELGPKSAEIHEKIGRKIGQVCDLAVITTKDWFKDIKRGFEQESGSLIRANKRLVLCGKPEGIFNGITTFCKSGDAVLLEGRVPKQLIELLLK